MSATPSSSSNPSAQAAAATASAPVAWTVPQLAAQLEAAGLDLRVQPPEASGDEAWGAQLDFAERSAPPGGAPVIPAMEGLTPLVEIGLIRVAGRDAASFLQGQLTNDVNLASPDRALLAGLCNPKGRLIASFWLWRDGVGDADSGDSFWLACSRDLAELLARRLKMFVLRAKATVTRHDHDHLALGLIGARAIASAADVLVEHDAPQARTVVALADPGRDAGGEGQSEGEASAAGGAVDTSRLPRALVLASVDELPVLARRATQGGLRWVDTRQWRWLEVCAALPRITAPCSEKFIPQMVNFERIGGVSFTKGCYPGQEVVARSHYRSTAKRRTFLFLGEGELPAPAADLDPAPGETEPAGIAVLAARDPAQPSRWALLAEARFEAVEAGLSWQGAALQALPLPYALVDAPAEPTATRPAAGA